MFARFYKHCPGKFFSWLKQTLIFFIYKRLYFFSQLFRYRTSICYFIQKFLIFCRVFKKETGHSPAQWRAMAGQAVRPLSPAESKREQELYI